MKRLILPLLIVVNAGHLYAQQDSIQINSQNANASKLKMADLTTQNKTVYEVQIEQKSGKKGKGYLTNLTDDEITYVNEKVVFGAKNSNINTVNYADINSITIKRKGADRQGYYIGLGIGAVVGLIMGSSSGDDDPNGWFAYSAGDKAMMTGLTVGAVGGIIGFIVGRAAKTTFVIGGKKENHKQMKFDVLQKIYAPLPTTAN